VQRIFDETEIRGGVTRLAAEISRDYGDKSLTVVGVLTGCVVFLADLIRLLDMPIRIGWVRASSYRGNATAPGQLVVHHDMLPPIEGQEVLIVDDIYDTGHTLETLIEQMQPLSPSSVRSAVLFRKRGRQQVSREPNYVGLEIPDRFVVGYGLDYDDMYRNLPYLAALDADELGGSGS